MAAWVETGFTQPPVLGGRRFRLICRSSFYSRFYRFTGHQHVMNTALDPLFLFFFPPFKKLAQLNIHIFPFRVEIWENIYSWRGFPRREGERFLRGGMAGKSKKQSFTTVRHDDSTATVPNVSPIPKSVFPPRRKIWERFSYRKSFRRVKIVQPLFHFDS